MLYKKYHRNYVKQFKQFKKGTKFVYHGKNEEMKFEVVREPYIYDNYNCIYISITKNGSCNFQMYLIYSSGRLGLDIKTVEFIENVV